MRSWLDKLLLWAVFLSTAFQNAAVDYEKKKTDELPPPNLNSSTNVVKMGQNVSLSCSSKKNTSVDITYSLFWGTKHIETKTKRGETVIFHLKISNTNETGPYKCKTNVSNLHKYSQELNFRIAKDSCPSCLLPRLLPGLLLGLLVIIIVVLVFLIHRKCKKGNAQRENKSKDSGDAPMQSELYANICEPQTQTEAGQPQELHYITPVFKEVAPREQEGCVGSPADYIYSELTH